MDIPASGGVYALVLRLDGPTELVFGRGHSRQSAPLEAGWYVYVGSAHGPGGLRARTDRHRRRSRVAHWHVDALLARAELVEIWFAEVAADREHAWAQRLARQPGAAIPVRGFGARDCRQGCGSHLVFLGAARPRIGLLGGSQRLFVASAGGTGTPDCSS